MSLKEAIRGKALELGFEDAGFTGVEPLDLYIWEVESRPPEMYGWVQTERFNTLRGARPGPERHWRTAAPGKMVWSERKLSRP
jgi:hypothetical protein